MIGSDGQEYVFIGSAKGSGSSIYEERTQYELLRKKKTGMNYSHISKPQKRELKPVDQIVPKNNENCSSIYTYMQNLLILDPAHKAYLHSQGWTDELIEKHHIVSFPEEDSLRVKYHNRYRTRNITRARHCRSNSTEIWIKFTRRNSRGVFKRRAVDLCRPKWTGISDV